MLALRLLPGLPPRRAVGNNRLHNGRAPFVGPERYVVQQLPLWQLLSEVGQM